MMERLTKGNSEMAWYKGEYEGKKLLFEPCEVMSDCSSLDIGKILRRLAYYEDLEEQGRLAVLPCRIEATVFDIRRFYKGRKVVRQEIVSGEIDHFTIGESGNVITTVCLHGDEWADYEPCDLILSREEAERALKESFGNGK